MTDDRLRPGQADIGCLVRVDDDHRPYAGEVAQLKAVDTPRVSRPQAYIKFEDGTGAWVSARRLSIYEKEE